MGYHIITNPNSSTPTSKYITSLDELMRQNYIPANSIVYQGEASWTPVRLEDHEILKDYADPEKRAGRRAELKFEQLAFENNYIVQRIDQDQKTYHRYSKIIGGKPKRSDYLIMNLSNVEIDVKCLKSYTIDKQQYFYMNKTDIDRHQQTLSKVHRQLIFAIFRRLRDWYEKDSLQMISINQVMQCELIHKSGEFIYLIPQKKLTKGFSLLDQYKNASPPLGNTIKDEENNFSVISIKKSSRQKTLSHSIILITIISSLLLLYQNARLKKSIASKSISTQLVSQKNTSHLSAPVEIEPDQYNEEEQSS